MAATYLSENDLPTLEARMNKVFVEKPLVVIFSLQPTQWAYDESTGKYKASMTVGTSDITGEPKGEVSLYLDNISTALEKLNLRKLVANTDLRLFNTDFSTSGYVTMDFYANRAPILSIPLVLTLNDGGENG